MISIKNLSIERKLIAMQLLTTFIVLLFYGMLLFFNDLHVLRKSVISRLTSMAQLIGANSISALNFLDEEAAEQILSSLKAEEDVVNAWIYDADGNLFARYSKQGYSDFKFPRIADEDYEFGIDYTTLSKKIIQNGDIIGMISLRLSMEQSRVIVNRKVLIAFLVLVIGMIIALILSHKTQRTISRPVLNLVNNSKNISETGNYSIRVEKEGDDEIGILCDTFNDMMTQIEKHERERDRAEEALRESENKFRTLTSNIPGAVYRCANDPDWTMDFISNVIEEISGYKASDFIENRVRTFASIIHPDDREMVEATVYEAISDHVPYIIEYRIIRSDASIRWVYEKGQGIFSDDGILLWLDGAIFDVTERKYVEEELKRTHSIYRKTIENSRGVPYQSKFDDNKFEFIGEGWEEIFGIPAQDFTFDQWNKIIKETIIVDTAAPTDNLAKYIAAFSNGEIDRYRADLRIVTPDGEEKWVNDCSLPIRDDKSGQVIGSLGILQDITERKRIEQELAKHKKHLEELVETRTIELIKANERLQQEIEERKRAEQRVRANEETYRIVIEQTGQMVYDYDIGTGKIRWLGDIHGTTGYTSDEFARVNIAAWEELIHPDDRGLTLEILNETMKKCSKFDVEYRLKSKNGTYLDMKDNGVFLKDDKGYVYRMLGTMKDITEQKRIEQARRENEEKFESIGTSAQDAIIIMESDGKISYWNDAAMKTFGYIKEEAIGQVLHKFLAPKRYHEAYEKAFSKFQETGQGDAIGKTIELFGIRKDGEEFPFELSLSSVKIKNKWNAIGILRDITERKKAEEKLKETQAQLVQSEKMASLGMLVAGVAHEINTPVGAISSMYDTQVRAVDRLKSTLDTICTKYPKEHQKISKLFKIIEDANNVMTSGMDRVTNIVQRLKSFARLDEVELQTVDIHEGIEDTLIIVHHELKHKAVVERNFGEIPLISCYPRQLNQVYLNLLVNAIQAIEEKGTITISTFQKNDHIYIQFKDNGVGIPEEAMNKIFDPGYTTKGVGVGTGLGLSICYQIVKDHHGEILVESEPGKGSTFTIVLPLTPIA